ncbi:hypothetical protein [Magnetococcus sp. PR-3]|uniref:hypothetical protein n=1 Tax=Magnetococcus sp. PR-3 TaxID=3120355 RepID=UPI002FCE2A79
MKLLLTIKPVMYHQSTASYAVLAEVDWAQQRVLRQLRLPAASYRCDEAFMAPLIGGVCHWGNRLFIAMWNYIVEVDYHTFQIVNSFSTPQMADLHGITTDGQTLWVAAAATEMVLGFDLKSLKPVWQWGPDAAILGSHPHLRIPPAWNQGWKARFLYHLNNKTPQALLPGEHRHQHKSRSASYHHHLNDVTYHQGKLYVTTSNWYNTNNPGAVIEVDPTTSQTRFMAQPGSFDGTHDTLFVDDRLYVTESRRNGIAWIEADGEIHRQKVEPSPYFVRALHWTGEHFLTGFTRLRHTQDPALLIAFDQNWQPITHMELSGFHPEVVGSAIHAMAPSPELN